ncbi:MAG: CHAT domain-containing protein [Myxococcales bacterium]|nr:CHAT domain-containing protein [Myxococcales bacterium]
MCFGPSARRCSSHASYRGLTRLVWAAAVWVLICASSGWAATPTMQLGARVLSVSGDGSVVALNRGASDGVTVGMKSVELYPNRKKAGAKSRSVDTLMRLARGTVIKVQPSRCEVQLRLRTGRLQVGDYASWPRPRPPGVKDSSLLRVAALDIGIVALNGGKPLLRLDSLLSGKRREQVWNVWVAEIHSHAKIAQRLYARTIVDGRFHGLTMKQAFEKTTRNDVETFVDFLAAFPGKYIGKDHKLVNIYATWVINRTRSGLAQKRKRQTAGWMSAAKTAERAGMFRQAEKQWRRVLGIWPQSAAAKAHLGRIERVALYRRALIAKPGDHRTRWKLARVLFRLHAHDAALSQLRTLETARVKLRQVQTYRAWIWVRQERFADAEALLSQLIAKRTSPKLAKWLRYAKARAQISGKGDVFAAHLAIAKIDEQERSFSNAQRRLRRAADAAKTPQQLAAVRTAQLRIRDFSRIETLALWIRTNIQRHDLAKIPRHASTIVQLARRHGLQARADKHLSEAAGRARDVWERPTAEVLQQARIDLGFKVANALRELAWIRYSGGQLKRARRALTDALKADQKNAYAHHMSGLVYLLRGDLERAEREARAALEWSRSYAWPRKTLTRVALARSKWDLGIRYAKEALARKPDASELQRALSDALALKRAAVPVRGDRRTLPRRRLHALRLWLRFDLYKRAARTFEMLRGTPHFDAACWAVLESNDVHMPVSLVRTAAANAEPSSGWQRRLLKEARAILNLPKKSESKRDRQLNRIDLGRAFVRRGSYHRAIRALRGLTGKKTNSDIRAMASDVINAARKGVSADALVNRASEARKRGGQWPLVARLQQRAMAMYNEVGSPGDAASAAFFAAFAVAAQGQVEEAVQQLNAISKRYKGQLTPLSDLDLRLAHAALQAQRGSLDAQHRVIAFGLKLCTERDEEICVAQTRLTRAGLHLTDGRLSAGRRDARHVRKFAKRRRMSLLARRALFQLADIELVAGHLVVCKRLGAELLRQARKDVDTHHERLGLMVLGAVAMRRANAEAARARFAEVLALGKRIGEKQVQATALLFLGNNALDAAHEPAKAAVHYAAAVALFEQIADDERIGRSQYGLARALNAQGQREAARKLLHTVIEGARKADRKTLLASALVELAWVDVEGGAPAKGLRAAREAYAITRVLDLDSSLQAALHVLGRALAGAGQTQAGLVRLQAAAKILAKRVRQSGGLDAQRGFLSFGRTRQVYKDAIDLLLKAGRVNDAMAIIELSKDASLRNMFDPNRIKTTDKKLKQTLGGLGAAERQVKAARKQLAVERARPAAKQSAARIKALDKRVAESAGKVRRLLLRLKARHHGLYQAFAVDPRNLVNDRKHLPDDALVLAYFLAGSDLYIFTIAKKHAQAHAYKVPLEGADLATLVTKYRRALVKRNPRIKRLGRKLHKLLIAPVAHELASVKTLLVMPTGPLYFLPFHALEHKVSGKGRYLIEDHRVAYLLSTTVNELKRPVRHGARKLLAAFANPDGTLPGAKAEVQRMQRDAYPKARVFFGPTADKGRVIKEASKHHVLHFATHGILDPDPLRSHLKMAKGALTVDDIAGIEFAEKTTLVVLSACKTAVAVGKSLGEGISIAEAFATAGVPTLVASLWNVPDAATSELMSRFYRHLRTGKGDTLFALRAAQLELMRMEVGGRRPFRHPLYWAGFELIGDYR